MPVALVTGFEPFGIHEENPSRLIARALDGHTVGDGVQIVSAELPVEYVPAQRIVPALWQQHAPDFVLHIGVGRDGPVRLETLAHNGDYTRLDNTNSPAAGAEHKCVDADSVSASTVLRSKREHNTNSVCLHFAFVLSSATATIDVKAASAAVKSTSGVPCEVSENAGRYLCEFVFFLSLYQSSMDKRVPVLFCHVPRMSADAPYTLPHLISAVTALLQHITTCSSSQSER